MLGRDHLHFRRSGKRIHPVFVETADPAFRELAGELLMIYQDALEERLSRGELDELLGPVVAANRTYAGGLAKLIGDGAEFQTPDPRDYRALRRDVFLRAAGRLHAGACALEPYRAEALASFEGDLYGDLPEHEHLVKLRSFTIDRLLDRYNLAQAQGLLLYADKVKLELDAPEAPELRMLFNYLKFFKLMGHCEKHGKLVTMTIDGPLSLMEQTRKYALSLAAFFPAVCRMKHWKLDAEIAPDKRPGRLVLDQSCNLKTHYRNFSTYVPEEVAMFRELFRQKADGWEIVPEQPVLRALRGEVFSPDMLFVQSGGEKKVYLELFHRWHRTALIRRLDYAEKHPELPLLIGIDRAIASDEYFAELSGMYPGMAERLFRFRYFPGVDRVLKMLDANLF